VAQATHGDITRRMRIACWILKAKDTHSQYVILIAFPLQLWLNERPSMLGYTHIACLVGFLDYVGARGCLHVLIPERHF
jgi:hypothetical protein